MTRILSEKEKQVISAVQLQADAPIAKVAADLKIKHHTLRYILERLKSEKILIPYPFINYVPLGFNEYDLYCSLSFAKDTQRTAFIEYIKQSPHISWLIGIGGDYQFGIGFLAEDQYSVSNLIETISAKFGAIFTTKNFANCIRWWVFRRKYLSAKPARVNELWVGPTEQKYHADDTDKLILTGLSNHPALSMAQLARKIGVPETTLSFRLKGLRAGQVLQGFAYSVDSARFNMRVYRIHISLSDLSQRTIANLFNFASRCPWITSFSQYAGAWDINMRVEVVEADEVFRLAQSLNDSFRGIISSLKVFPLFEEIKLSPFPGFQPIKKSK